MTARTPALADAKTAWRARAMFRAMTGDRLLREQFATDPAQIFCDYALSEPADEVEAEVANQLIFAIVSNPYLRRWMGSYSRRLGGRGPSRHAFAAQFADAAAAARDPVVTFALVRSAAAEGGVFHIQADILRAFLSLMSGSEASGTEMSPGGGTEISPGGGTEMSPGSARLAERLSAEIRIAGRIASSIIRAEDGTEQSPGGGGTEQSPGGGGTEMSPGTSRRIAALVAAVRRAELFLSDLVRAADGTEQSPGGGTEVSPGGGTEMSPGARIFERLAIELASASRFAVQLRALESDGTEQSPGGGTEQSPGGGTEISPGGGTEQSPGALRLSEALAASLRRAELFSSQLIRQDSGTEQSPGGGTEISPGGGTEMSPGAIRLTERLAAEFDRAARYLSELRGIEAEGTEQSPGGGTEQSPGGGTEMSPGALRLRDAFMAALRRAELFSAQLARVEDGTEMSPGGTQMSPGHGTEMSPGGARLADRLSAEVRAAAREASQALRFADGTEMSPGGGTEMSPGHGTEQSPGALRSIDTLARALNRAELLLAQITLEDGTEQSPGGGTEVSPGGGGTEVSPGGGTEVSPGGGTEVSPGSFGGLWGVRLPAYVAEPLGALVQYALALRRQGLLSVSGLETA